MKTFVLTLIIGVMTGCGGEQPATVEKVDSAPEQKEYKPNIESYCGDYVCDEDIGEDYWNCLDCVDMPEYGRCGDGICYKETILDCYRDCGPMAVNNGGNSFSWPNPSPAPRPKPEPYPEPRPIPEPGPMDKF